MLLNIFKMMANADTLIVPVTRLGGAILSRQKLDAKLRELVILQVAPHIEGGGVRMDSACADRDCGWRHAGAG